MPDLFLQLENDYSTLCSASIQIRDFLAGCEAPEAAIFLANLVVEELVTNTIKYGYDDACVHRIFLKIQFYERCLCIEIRDDGHAFNPITQKAPDLNLPANERPIGGLGIHFVRQMSDEFRYKRHGDENIVIVTKTFP